MTHRRTQLRNAFVDHLKDATAAEERVFSGRLMPVEEPELPAIVVHTREPEKILGRNASGWDGYEDRRCIVSVIGVLQSFDDIDAELDDLAQQIEAALQSWTIPGFESCDALLDDTDTSDPEFDGSLSTATITLRYAVVYRTPYRDCSNPYVTGDDEPLERSGAYPGGRVTAGCPVGNTGEACPIGDAELISNQEPIN